MKLRNKKTGEIVDYNPTLERWNGPIKEIKHYVSIAELNAEWEDYEEPKGVGYWYYDTTVNRPDFIENSNVTYEDKKLDKQIGNYFGTEEEAKKAVEKLKAWNRLKDKGFRFDGYELVDSTIRFKIDLSPLTPDDLYPELELLFGGEE